LRGGIDGFVARINSQGTTLTHATYVGTTETDQTYFLQLDALANVYVLGQTRGNFPRTAGLYGVANGRQFIQKFDNTLTSNLYSTTFGTGRTAPDLSLTAFLVDDCERIYVSGWGGNTNSNGGNTQGLPTTADASQRTTDGSDFYIVQFKPGLTAIEYATFFGEIGGRGEHVDGGTSRFDKRGAIYQAVCGGCGGTSGFPVPPGANYYSTTNNARNCNNSAFKVDFAAQVVNPGPDRTVCFSAGPQRLGGSPAGGVWSGPGVTALSGGGYQFTPNPALVGRNTLTYTVNTTGVCQSTKLLRITVTPEAAITFAPPATVCSNTTAVALTATPAGGTFSGPGVTGRNFNPSVAGVGRHTVTYTLSDSLGCGITSRVIVVDAQPTVVVSADTTLCSDQVRAFRMLRASPAGGTWSGIGVTADGMFTPPITNNQGGIFTLEYTVTVGSCKIVAARKVIIAPTSATNVSLNIPECQTAPEYSGLAPFTMQFKPVLVGGTFSWDFGDGTTSTEESPTHVYENEGSYPVKLTARYAGCTVVTQFAAVKVGKVQIPNIFTPNNDNLNETFAPRLGCLPAHLTVFSRWGKKVYEATDYHNDWRGDMLPDGVYYYLLRDTEGKSTKGWVEIKR
jgi:gliding motility-associated-like protein